MSDQFVRHVPRAGIPAGFTPHSLRHVYASVVLVEGGVDITEVARFLGHRDVNETYRTYGHLVPNANDKVIPALDAEFARWSTCPRGKRALPILPRWVSSKPLANFRP